ncbi:MAG: toll/interleukin-1 receptor domain-containing protein [Clostridiales bacterium]|nr:toll/interleukin-1 receptor domain-containing protein [Clostridiales bacterium]
MHNNSNFFKGEVYEGNEAYAFISYAHKDSEAVLPLISDLNEKGLRVWFDEGIEAGSEWPEYLAEHLAKASVVLAFISGNFDESKYCRREMHYATKLNKPIISIYVDDTELSYGLEMELSSIQGFKKSNFTSEEMLVQSIISVKVIDSILVKLQEPEQIEELRHSGNTMAENIVQESPVANLATRKSSAPVKNDKPAKKRVNKSGKTGRIILIVAGSLQLVILLIIVAIWALGSGMMAKQKKQSSEITDYKVQLLTASGKEFKGEITEEMLLGTYTHMCLDGNEFDRDYKFPDLFSDYPDMKFVERMTNPKTGTASRSVASAVPLYIKCSRLIDNSSIGLPSDFEYSRDSLDTEAGWKKLYNCLRASDPVSADGEYNKYVDLYNTFYVEMYFYTEIGSKAEGFYRYIYTIENNVMYCSRMDFGNNNEIIYYDSVETYKIGFIDNRLIIEADGSNIELIPRNLCYYILYLSTHYSAEGYLYDPDNAYLDITGISIGITNSKYDLPKETVKVYFKDGSYTTDAQAEWNSWGNPTLSWYAVYHPDTRTTDAEPNTISIRIMGEGPFFIVDEEGNAYNYTASSADVYKDPVKELSYK